MPLIYPSDIGQFIIGQSPIGGTVPQGFTSVVNITPAYLYVQYNDDDNVRAFFDAFNAYAQTYLNFINNLNLPIYTQGLVSGLLLDWVGANLYGIPRPGLPTIGSPERGPLGTYMYGRPPPLGRGIPGVPSTYTLTSDDVYRRCITWQFWKGDGHQFSIPWLKRRINRFLNGLNGTIAPVPTTYGVSVTSTGSAAYTITIANTPLGVIFQEAVKAGVLELPFQITWTVTLV